MTLNELIALLTTLPESTRELQFASIFDDANGAHLRLPDASNLEIIILTVLEQDAVLLQ